MGAGRFKLMHFALMYESIVNLRWTSEMMNNNEVFVEEEEKNLKPFSPVFYTHFLLRMFFYIL